MAQSTTSNVSESNQLLDALEHLEAVAFVPAKQRYTDASQLVQTIASDAYENGISEDALGRVLKILTAKNHLDQSATTTLVKNLYPQERIASKYVTQVVCCLGPSKSKPNPATQALLVRWLIMILDLMEDRTHLGKLYAVLFNHLDMISLRKPLCHLLSTITRRKHVKPFRIQALMELIQSAGGEEKELLSLLKTFKNYCPEIVLGNIGVNRKTALFFKHPDPDWTSHAKLLLDQSLELKLAAQQSSYQVIHRGLAKRSRVEVIVPALQTSRVSNKHTSLEEIRNTQHFVDRLDKIDLPNQIVSTLGDAMAQKYIHLVQSEAANARLDDWLTGFLADKLAQIKDGQDDDLEALTFVLSYLEAHTSFAKVGIILSFLSFECCGKLILLQVLLPSIESFLASYLPIWNGQDNRALVLRLLQYLPVDSFESLRNRFFVHLENAILDSTVSSRVELLNFYSSLITEWGAKLSLQPGGVKESLPLSSHVRHAEILASSIIELTCIFANASSDSPVTVNSVLQFYRSIARLFSRASRNASIRLTVPMAPTIYSIAFTPNISAISALNSILADYKSSFETSLTSDAIKDPTSSEPLYSTDLVNQFNGFVMDMCNLIWRNRALNTEDPNAQGCLVPAKSVNAFTTYVRNVNEAARHYDRDSAFHLTLASLFSLSNHAAFANLSAACFADVEEMQNITGDRPRLQKPVTQKALQALEKEQGAKFTWQEYRVHMLEWLDAVGSRGTSDLMRSTMKALRKES
ncbi:hypothetical protein N7539_004913 [Penicillium diatomitis]|uniref:Uncharacterized protein n=1 Tax=Penicillium diatomitis TaxID=2819901 RepID=A0A9W9X5Y0_9EURO|nr:uncharacterized protein N7539_004913 [Penicillium diatomitis]KAJ5484925.1 hypothetical protein N7539_004913 [Penicillium diatomitis]